MTFEQLFADVQTHGLDIRSIFYADDDPDLSGKLLAFGIRPADDAAPVPLLVMHRPNDTYLVVENGQLLDPDFTLTEAQEITRRVLDGLARRVTLVDLVAAVRQRGYGVLDATNDGVVRRLSVMNDDGTAIVTVMSQWNADPPRLRNRYTVMRGNDFVCDLTINSVENLLNKWFPTRVEGVNL